jgi:hypothetical protein
VVREFDAQEEEGVPDGEASDETALIEVLPEALDAWEKIEASGLKPRMKRALRSIAAGESVREASLAEGYSAHSPVYRQARRFGLMTASTQAIINSDRRIAKMAGAEIEVRLLNEPESMTVQQLGVLKGISTDKILAYDKDHGDSGDSWMSVFEIMAERIVASGVEMELKVSIKPAAPQAVTLEAETIDVTPMEETNNE